MSSHFGNIHFTAQVKSSDEVFKKALGGDRRKFPLKPDMEIVSYGSAGTGFRSIWFLASPASFMISYGEIRYLSCEADKFCENSTSSQAEVASSFEAASSCEIT
jgi:hypothetical protein